MPRTRHGTSTSVVSTYSCCILAACSEVESPPLVTCWIDRSRLVWSAWMSCGVNLVAPLLAALPHETRRLISLSSSESNSCSRCLRVASMSLSDAFNATVSGLAASSSAGSFVLPRKSHMMCPPWTALEAGRPWNQWPRGETFLMLLVPGTCISGNLARPLHSGPATHCKDAWC